MPDRDPTRFPSSPPQQPPARRVSIVSTPAPAIPCLPDCGPPRPRAIWATERQRMAIQRLCCLCSVARLQNVFWTYGDDSTKALRRRAPPGLVWGRVERWNPSYVGLCSHAWPKSVFSNTSVGLDCDSIPVNPPGEKLLLLSYVNHFSRLPLARPRVRERHPCPSRAERRRFAAASPLAASCLASAVALLPAALVVLDPHVHALPSSCVRTPPFVGRRPIPAALIFGEPLPPLPCPITVRFGCILLLYVLFEFHSFL